MVREANMKALASEKALAESNMKVGNIDGVWVLYRFIQNTMVGDNCGMAAEEGKKDN